MSAKSASSGVGIGLGLAVLIYFTIKVILAFLTAETSSFCVEITDAVGNSCIASESSSRFVEPTINNVALNSETIVIAVRDRKTGEVVPMATVTALFERLDARSEFDKLMKSKPTQSEDFSKLWESIQHYDIEGTDSEGVAVFSNDDPLLYLSYVTVKKQRYHELTLNIGSHSLLQPSTPSEPTK
ncbi:MAG: hypothetical protein A2Z75_02000 [Chloroflexi bacterium RBG_13_50_10]|nr:MAG: hypothetical protein A2Z75_02000 [Chloroflexi bacterium RBG_13_50_10]